MHKTNVSLGKDSILNHSTRQLSSENVLDELCLYRKLVMFQSNPLYSTEIEQLFSWLHQCGNVLVQTLMLQLIEQCVFLFNLSVLGPTPTCLGIKVLVVVVLGE
jgi:hypothetical protein